MSSSRVAFAYSSPRLYGRVTDASRAWQHAWLRIERLIRSILAARWDTATWPSAKAYAEEAGPRRPSGV